MSTTTSPAAAGATNTHRPIDSLVDDAVDQADVDQADVERQVRTALDGWPARLGRRLTPPEPWRYRPASLAAMWRYARIGAWTRDGGLLRFCGCWYFRLVALPVALVTHYVAWLTQRPSRLLTALVIYGVIVHIGPGRLLPWPTWLP